LKEFRVGKAKTDSIYLLSPRFFDTSGTFADTSGTIPSHFGNAVLILQEQNIGTSRTKKYSKPLKPLPNLTTSPRLTF
jgi:hypothetical protein